MTMTASASDRIFVIKPPIACSVLDDAPALAVFSLPEYAAMTVGAGLPALPGRGEYRQTVLPGNSAQCRDLHSKRSASSSRNACPGWRRKFASCCDSWCTLEAI